MKQRRHPARHLIWRGVVAGVSNVAMATGLYPIVPHIGLAVSRRRKKSRQPPGALRATAVEWAVSVALSAARPVGFVGLPVSVRRPRGPRPIIVVHGYAMNRANFLPLTRRLVAAGLGPVYGFEYWTLGKASAAARALGEYVERVCERSGAERVDIIGHSMGGIVGRYYATLGGPSAGSGRSGADRIAHLITVGTPHQGTDVSAIGIGHANKELFPRSALIQRLEAAGIPEQIEATAIWSRADALCPGSRHATLPGAEQIVYDDLGHLSMLMSRRVADEIIARLRG